MNKAKREGELKGELKERYKNVLELIQTLYQKDASHWLKECNKEQLKRAFTLVGKQLSYEEFKEAIEKG